MIINFKNNNSGFTIIEVILAIFIITATVTGSFVLIQQTLNFSSLNQSKLVAYYLSQEGLELTRNIRDNNWLKQETDPFVVWDDGLDDGNWEIDYKTKSLTINQDRYLYISGADNFYNYISSPLPTDHITKFKRKIIVNKITSDSLEITSRVQWIERGINRQVEASEYLYNWYGY